MTQRNLIRKLYYEQGKSISEIARDHRHDRKTIRKCIAATDFNRTIPSKSNAGRPEKLKPFCQTIDEWLLADLREKRKQRHTAKRVYDRLKEEYPDTFRCCYKTVSNYVSRRKIELCHKETCSLPLEHIPGEAQADFGAADFIERGKRYAGYYLNLAFPHSNQGYVQLFKGESQECLFEGLSAIFDYLGGVPGRIWFDNASTMVKNILQGGERELTEAFLRFQNHYRFEAVFCNPGAGNEKGSVEAKVGYHRRNLLVPIPRVENLSSFNRDLLARCTNDGSRPHYRKDLEIRVLHQQDLTQLLPLPEIPFDCATYLPVRINAYGKFTLYKGLHEYSTLPKMAGQRGVAKVTAHTVQVLDETYRPLVTHDRLYGGKRQSSMQWIPYLTQLAKKPGALKYSGIYPMMPDPLKVYLSNCNKSDQGKVLRAIERISRDAGFEQAVQTVKEALLYQVKDVDSLLTLHAYKTTFEQDLKPAKVPSNVPDLAKVLPDVKAYDAFLEKAGVVRC